MRIATWNINGLRARLEFIKIWLEARQPDIVGLQEVKVSDEEFPTREFNDLGYEVEFHGQKGWNGVAILSRIPMHLNTRGLPGQEEQGARLICAQTDDLSFTTVYVPNGKDVEHPDFELKLAWLDALAEHWTDTEDASKRVVLCGDFNIVPAAIDTWRGESGDGRIFCTQAERARFKNLLDCGLYDLFRDKYPKEQKFSWWDYRSGAFHRGQGLRIDFVLATEPVRAHVEEVVIDRDFRKKQDGLTASDHAPVIVDLTD